MEVEEHTERPPTALTLKDHRQDSTESSTSIMIQLLQKPPDDMERQIKQGGFPRSAFNHNANAVATATAAAVVASSSNGAGVASAGAGVMPGANSPSHAGRK